MADTEQASLVASVEAAVAQMTWLGDTDQATVELAMTYARRIDAAIESEQGPDVTKALYLGPHLLNALRALGGAPAERKALGLEAPTHGKLADLRAARAS